MVDRHARDALTRMAGMSKPYFVNLRGLDG